MIFVDTESHIEQQTPTLQKHTLNMGAAVYVRRRTEGSIDRYTEDWLHFDSADMFWAWCTSKIPRKSRLYVFCHNWNYDAGILNVSNWFESNGWQCWKYINDRPPVYISFRKNGRTLQIVDTLNYFAGSVKYIGEVLGVPKLSMPDSDADVKAWRRYNKRDVEIIRDATLAFIDLIRTHDLGNFQPTLASQAFGAFRHKYMHKKILIHDNDDVNQLERLAYKGGRSECFRLGEFKEPLYYLDINSMYPFIMKEYHVPRYLEGSSYGMATRALEDALKLRCVAATVTLKTNEPAYGVRWDGRLIFPIGTFDATLTSEELLYALSKGHIKRVKHAAVYERAVIFRDYVEDIYALRRRYKREQNEVFEYLCKIMLNSLYGKFGQNGTKWENSRADIEPFNGILIEQATPESPIERYRFRLGQLQIFERKGESTNSFPGIAAHITGAARIMLWRLITKAGRDNVYYTDTDSLIVNAIGYDNLAADIDPDNLGSLKVEHTADNAVFFGPKDYHFAAMEKHKGIKAKARRLSGNEWEQERFYSWDYLLSRNQDGYILVETVRKKLHRIYRKGTIQQMGRIRPYVVKNEEINGIPLSPS